MKRWIHEQWWNFNGQVFNDCMRQRHRTKNYHENKREDDYVTYKNEMTEKEEMEK